MAIPKVIHYCWFGEKEKPESVKKCIDSWKKYCPEYEIKEWTEKDFDVKKNIYCLQAYEEKAWGFVPDYIRLWIIYNYGGIYLDTDVEIVKNFDKLLENTGFAGFEAGSNDEEGYYVNLGQGFGAEAGNKIIEENMKIYDALLYRNEKGELNKTPSPQYTTKVLKKNGLNRKRNEIQYMGGFTIYSSDYFCPKSYRDGVIRKTKNTYSIHNFDSSWFTEEEKIKKEKKWEEIRNYDRKYLPNRIIRKLLGNKTVDIIKVILGKVEND